MRRDTLLKAIEEVLVCPVCKGQLSGDHDLTALRCDVCGYDYVISDGIPLLLPPGPLVQEQEKQFRDARAAEYLSSDRETLLTTVARHHNIPLMRTRARNFRARFKPEQLVLDIGIGYGWHWSGEQSGAKILGVDASLGNLRLAQQLLGQQDDVILVCADAAAMPIRERTISGVWSVQVFQHFPENVFRSVLIELDRVLLDDFAIEIYNLNPAILHRTIYRLTGRRLHLHGCLGEMELNRFSAREWAAAWGRFRTGRSRLRSNYSELFFHPDFHFRPQHYPIGLESALAKSLPWLAGLFARQSQIMIDARTSE